VRAPIDVSAIALGPVYNLRPGGLDWKPFYSELDLVFANQTDIPYENLDVLVRPNVPVAGMAQSGNLSGVSFRDRYGVVANASVKNPVTNEVLKAILLATDSGYSVHCKEIPPHSSLQLVLETVGIKPTAPPSGSLPQNGQMVVPNYAQLKDFTFTQAVPDEVEKKTFYYWFGSEQSTQIFVPNVKPREVTVRGSYVARYLSRGINMDISVRQMAGPYGNMILTPLETPSNTPRLLRSR
jgi:hypothetical protein